MFRSIFISILLLLSIFTESVFAIGSLYARKPLTNNSYFPLWLKNYDATVTITDQMAVTHVDQTFKNETNMRLEGIFFFPLPENAIVTGLILWINGVPVEAQVMDSDTAQSIYNNVVQNMIDPALLEYMGDNIFKLSVFPIEANGHQMSERRIEITYAELLPYDGGNIDYTFLMKSINLSSKPVERASIAINLKSQKEILSLMSPTHDNTSGIVINKVSNNEYNITYGEENAHSEKDLTIYYELKNDDFAINHLTYVPNTDSAMFFDSLGDDSYYLLWITPPDDISQSQIIKKNIVFVADISSSMAGERMEQLRKSLNTMVSMLNKKDMFNIIAFNTGTSPFQGDLVSADSDVMVESAHVFIDELGEVGMTNMEDAFKEALASTWDDTSMNTIVFLTDGKPTWPITTSEAEVIKTVATYNTDTVSVYTFGIGEEPGEGFLKQLAKENHGFSIMIMQDDSIEMVLGNFMSKISYPLIKNIAIDYGGLDKYDIFPKTLPNLYAGTQLTIIGRYRNTGSFNTTFSGMIGTKPISFSSRLTYPSAMPNHPFVARMWASSKIDFLLDEIEIYGKQPELVNAVKYLGKRYAILTPFTSFIVIEDPVVIQDKIKPLAKDLRLLQNHPNPFRVSTTIRFSVPKSESAKKVELKIFDLRGKLIKVLMNEMTMGGNYDVKWDARDAFGKKVGTGIYVAVLKAGNVTKMITMRLVR
jgi:Ca-activated chloride channel family protein